MCLYNKKKKRNLPCANKRLFLVDVHFIANLVKSFRDTDCVVHLQHLLCLCLGDFFVEQGLQVVVIKMPESVNKRLKIKDFIRQTPKRALGHFKDGELWNLGVDLQVFLLWMKIKSDKFQLKRALINGSCVHSTCFHNYNVLFPSDYSKSNSSFNFLRNKYLVHAWQLSYFYFLCALKISFKFHNQYLI